MLEKQFVRAVNQLLDAVDICAARSLHGNEDEYDKVRQLHGVATLLAHRLGVTLPQLKEAGLMVRSKGGYSVIRPGDAKQRDRWLEEMVKMRDAALGVAELDKPTQLDNPTSNCETAASAEKARSRKKPAEKGKGRITSEEANAIMFRAIEEEPERLKWSVRKWQQYVGCGSTSTIHKTAMWSQGEKARLKAKQEWMQRMQGKRKGKHRPRD